MPFRPGMGMPFPGTSHNGAVCYQLCYRKLPEQKCGSERRVSLSCSKAQKPGPDAHFASKTISCHLGPLGFTQRRFSANSKGSNLTTAAWVPNQLPVATSALARGWRGGGPAGTRRPGPRPGRAQAEGSPRCKPGGREHKLTFKDYGNDTARDDLEKDKETQRSPNTPCRAHAPCGRAVPRPPSPVPVSPVGRVLSAPGRRGPTSLQTGPQKLRALSPPQCCT